MIESRPRDRILTHFLLALLFAVALYLLSYSIIEHLRTRRGAWKVTFQTDGGGLPKLLVSEPRLGITNFSFAFTKRLAETNLDITISFHQPITNVPFGRVIYLDTTFLPGSVVLELFDHEIQLLPRVVVVDRHEISWQTATPIELK